MKQKLSILSLILLAGLVSHDLTAQFKMFKKSEKSPKVHRTDQFEPHSSVSFGVGTSSYYGELSPYVRPIQSTFNMIRWNLAFNYTRYFTQNWSGRIGLTYARIAGDDNTLEGVKGFEANFIRNLHFRNDIKELSLLAQYDFKSGGRSYERREKVVPYLFGGIAVFAHNPMAKPESSLYGTDWVTLQDKHTEGQGLPGYTDKPYSLIGVSFPIGFGVRVKINKDFDFGAEVGFRYSMTDYLDDVGGKYAATDDLRAQSPLAASLGDRSQEQIAAYSGKDRTQSYVNFLNANGIPISDPNAPVVSTNTGIGLKGNPRGSSSVKDSYMLTNFSIIYHLPVKIKCPPLR